MLLESFLESMMSHLLRTLIVGYVQLKVVSITIFLSLENGDLKVRPRFITLEVQQTSWVKFGDSTI